MDKLYIQRIIVGIFGVIGTIFVATFEPNYCFAGILCLLSGIVLAIRTETDGEL